jgi:hypothetical protein
MHARRGRALMPWADRIGLLIFQRQAEVADLDLPDGTVVGEILLVIARRSISLSRIESESKPARASALDEVSSSSNSVSPPNLDSLMASRPFS